MIVYAFLAFTSYVQSEPPNRESCLCIDVLQMTFDKTFSKFLKSAFRTTKYIIVNIADEKAVLYTNPSFHLVFAL